MQRANIFIDEFGNTAMNLSKEGTFSHFVYASVIIAEDNLEKAEQVRQLIAKKFKLGVDIKSSNIKEKQFDKRLQILKYLIQNLDFTIDVLSIDKRRIESNGLIYKRVFYKYFQTLYVSKYSKRYRSFYITADNVGEDFRKELQHYVNKHGIQRELFNPERFFLLADDKEEKLLQLADFLAGCVGKIFCTSHAHERAREIYDIIKTRLSVDYFPYPEHKKAESINQFDNEIRNMNFELVKDYYETAQTSVDSETIRFLEYLSLQSEINSNRFISTTEIVTYLQLFQPDFSKEKLRSIVRELRYCGLFIVSHSGKAGYKLATCYSDIAQHFEHFMKHVIPMLQKVSILNQKLSQNSFNKINLLEKDPTLKQMKELVSSIH